MLYLCDSEFIQYKKMAKANRIQIIKLVNTPLSFFVLALLIIESFLGLIIVKADIGVEYKLPLIYAGLIIFLIEIFFVFYLIFCGKAKDLTYNRESHLAMDKINVTRDGGRA